MRSSWKILLILFDFRFFCIKLLHNFLCRRGAPRNLFYFFFFLGQFTQDNTHAGIATHTSSLVIIKLLSSCRCAAWQLPFKILNPCKLNILLALIYRIFVMFSRGPVAQWIRHLTPNQGIPGSSPGRVEILFTFWKEDMFLFTTSIDSLLPIVI